MLNPLVYHMFLCDLPFPRTLDSLIGQTGFYIYLDKLDFVYILGMHEGSAEARDLLTGRVSSTGVKWVSILQFYWLFFCPSCLVVKPV